MTDRPQVHADPSDAIVGDLTSRAAHASGQPAGTDDGTPVPRVSRGRPFSTIVESVRCRKERAIQGRRLYGTQGPLNERASLLRVVGRCTPTYSRGVARRDHPDITERSPPRISWRVPSGLARRPELG
jgi:hypothetical protein